MRHRGLRLQERWRIRRAHVAALQQQLARHAPGARLICLTDLPDMPAGVERRALQHDLPGWFSKLEIFDLPERCFLYIDLDVFITRSPLTDAPPGLWLLRCFKGRDFNSSVMLVNGNYRRILERFLADTQANLQAYSGCTGWGDQDFIRDSGQISGALQDLHPNLAASWKVDLRYRMDWIDPAPAVLVFHGKPKPEQLRIENPKPGWVRMSSSASLLWHKGLRSALMPSPSARPAAAENPQARCHRHPPAGCAAA